MELVDKLGNYIERLDRPNSDLRYGIDDVCGITNTKQLVIGTKANLIGRTFEKFTILSPREFIFNRRTSRNGERISLGFNTTDRDWILTEDYCHFRIRKDKEDVLDPDYLYLFFLNPEFDRYVRYNSWGSATEFFNWEEITETPISIIPISMQHKIVHDYQVITDRIALLHKMNENLEEQNLALYKAYFVDFEMFDGKMPLDWKRTTVGNVVSVTRGASPRPIQEFMCEVGMPWVKIADASASFSKYLFETAECIIEDGVSKSRLVKPKTLIVSNSASPGLPMLMEIEACVHDGWLIIDQYKGVSQEFMYYFFVNERQRIVLQSNGSVFNNLKTDIVKEQQIVIPDEKTMDSVTEKFKAVNRVILNNAKEVEFLKNIRKNLLGTIMCKEAKGA